MLEGEVVRLSGDVQTARKRTGNPRIAADAFEGFIKWQPTQPHNARQLAQTTARLCRLLRWSRRTTSANDEALTSLAKEWQRLLFPDASDDRFADGYAQAVTFGLLIARARGIRLADGLEQVASELRETNSLIGTALRLLTDQADSHATLKTSLRTLIRVLDAVNWSTISRNKPDSWLYFYEDFLAEYDNELRKQTGSYYTPPEVVTSMTRLVHEALITRFSKSQGLAGPKINIADPAMGTGTFLLGVLKQIADTVADDEGEGQVPPAVRAAIRPRCRLRNAIRSLRRRSVANHGRTGGADKAKANPADAPVRREHAGEPRRGNRRIQRAHQGPVRAASRSQQDQKEQGNHRRHRQPAL